MAPILVAVAVIMAVQLTVVEGFLPFKTATLRTIRLQRPSITSPSSSGMATTFHQYSVQKQTIPIQNEVLWPVARLVRSWVAKMGAVVAVVLAALVSIPTSAQATAVASAMKSNALKVKGWDLFGRVPHDEWMFTTWRLTDPGLLKRSIVEAVVTELPDAFGFFKRAKRINEIATMGKGVGCFILVGCFAALLYKSAMQASLKRLAKEDKERGFARPVSAVSKQGTRKGKDIGGMDGWVDMESSDDDDKKKDDDDDDDK